MTCTVGLDDWPMSSTVVPPHANLSRQHICILIFNGEPPSRIASLLQFSVGQYSGNPVCQRAVKEMCWGAVYENREATVSRRHIECHPSSRCCLVLRPSSRLPRNQPSPRRSRSWTSQCLLDLCGPSPPQRNLNTPTMRLLMAQND